MARRLADEGATDGNSKLLKNSVMNRNEAAHYEASRIGRLVSPTTDGGVHRGGRVREHRHPNDSRARSRVPRFMHSEKKRSSASWKFRVASSKLSPHVERSSTGEYATNISPSLRKKTGTEPSTRNRRGLFNAGAFNVVTSAVSVPEDSRPCESTFSSRKTR